MLWSELVVTAPLYELETCVSHLVAAAELASKEGFNLLLVEDLSWKCTVLYTCCISDFFQQCYEWLLCCKTDLYAFLHS
jgi:hypothetical protein